MSFTTTDAMGKKIKFGQTVVVISNYEYGKVSKLRVCTSGEETIGLAPLTNNLRSQNYQNYQRSNVFADSIDAHNVLAKYHLEKYFEYGGIAIRQKLKRQQTRNTSSPRKEQA